MEMRRAIAISKTYKLQLRAIRLRMLEIDDDPSLDDDEKISIEYKALEAAEKRVIAQWKQSRTRNGLSNDAIPGQLGPMRPGMKY